MSKTKPRIKYVLRMVPYAILSDKKNSLMLYVYLIVNCSKNPYTEHFYINKNKINITEIANKFKDNKNSLIGSRPSVTTKLKNLQQNKFIKILDEKIIIESPYINNTPFVNIESEVLEKLMIYQDELLIRVYIYLAFMHSVNGKTEMLHTYESISENIGYKYDISNIGKRLKQIIDILEFNDFITVKTEIKREKNGQIKTYKFYNIVLKNL